MRDVRGRFPHLPFILLPLFVVTRLEQFLLTMASLSCRLSYSFLRSCHFRLLSTKANPDAFKTLPQFSSPYSSDKLYPKSTESKDKPTLEVSTTEKFTGVIPIEKLTITYARSSGPGGQHMQKTNTKVRISFHLESADWIPDKAKKELLALHKNRITKDGIWQVTSEKTRCQTLNLADCMDKIRCYITEAMKDIPVPSIETLEKQRDSAEKAAAARLRSKNMNSMRKTMKRENY